MPTISSSGIFYNICIKYLIDLIDLVKNCPSLSPPHISQDQTVERTITVTGKNKEDTLGSGVLCFCVYLLYCF